MKVLQFAEAESLQALEGWIKVECLLVHAGERSGSRYPEFPHYGGSGPGVVFHLQQIRYQLY